MIDTTSNVCAEPTASLLGPVFGDLTLRICGTRYDGQVIRIGSEKCSIGSGLGCTLRLRAAGIDPLHCLILRGQSKTVVKQWSPNTRLNGRSFTDARINVGDRLSIGPIEFEVLPDTPHVTTKSESFEPAEDHGDHASLELKLNESRQLGRNRVRNLTGELRSTRRRLNELEGIADERTQQVIETDARLEELEAITSKLRDEREAIDAQRQFAEDRLSKLDNESRQWKDQLEEFKQLSTSQREEWEQERGRLLQELNRCQEELEAQVQAAAELPSSANQIPANQTMVLTGARHEDGEVKWTDDFSQATDAHEQERQEWETERANLLEVIEDCKRQLDAQSQPKAELTDAPRSTMVLNGAQQVDGQVKWADELLEAKEAYDRDRQQWSREAEQLQRELTKYFQQTQKQEEALKSAAEQAAAQRLEWEQEVSELRESLSAVEQPIPSDEKLAKKLADAETKLSAAKEEIKQLRVQLSELDREQEVYHSRNMGRESEVRKAEAVLDERARQLDESRSQLNHVREALEAERAEFEEERRRANKELMSRLEKSEREAEELPRELDSTEDGERARQLEAAYEKLAAEREAFEQERVDWEGQRQQWESQMSEETANLARQEAELASQWAELSGLEAGTSETPGHTVRWSALSEEGGDEFSSNRKEEDEIAFEQTSDAPPLSTAEVFAKMGRTDLLAVDEDSDSDAVASDYKTGSAFNMPKNSATGSSLRSTQPLSAVAPMSNDAGEDSIEDYMARLLKRVRGEELGSTPLPAANIAENCQPSTFGNDVVSAKSADRDESLDPATYVPRRQAPEASNNLAAMRELANQSARAAIQTSEKHRKKTASRSKLAIAGAAAVIGFGLLLLSNGILSLTVFGALSFFGVAGFLGHQAIAMRKAKPAADNAHDCAKVAASPPAAHEKAKTEAAGQSPSSAGNQLDDNQVD